MDVEQILRKCSAPELEAVASSWELEETEWKGKGQRVVLRRLQECLDDENMEDELKEGLYLKAVPCLQQANAQKLMKVLLIKEEGGDLESTRIHNVSMQEMLQSSSLRRELKIVGTIGSGKERDQVPYIGLVSQVQEAKAKEYSEEEIARAVKKAVSAGCSLRTILDSKPDLSLTRMLALIRSFMKEKSSTELFQELNSTCQTENEDAQEFVLRAMELRQKVIIASDADGALKYDPALVNALFTHTVRTGLLDDAVKARLEPFLTEGITVSDELLISKVNVASSEEKERKAKQTNGRRRVTVNQVAAGEESDDVLASAVASAVSPLLKGMKEMEERLSCLQSDMANMRRGGARGRGRGRGGNAYGGSRFRGCSQCRQQNRGDECRHCWKCGAADHYAYECSAPLNG